MTISASTQIRPRPVFCVIEHAYRDRRIADDVCLGKFTENGVTLELGLEPNWLKDGLPHDEEWRIAWIKFYFGLELAAAYSETGEARFQQAWEKLVASWMQQAPADFGPTDAHGRRIQNWIYAWNMFADAPHFSGLAEGLDEKIVASVAEQTRYLRNHLTAERNHRTLELYALLIVALALPEAADPDLLDFAMEAFYQNLLADVRPDGVHREHSTHYHMMVLRSYLGARENVRRFGLSFPRDYDERLERACEFAMHCHRPDGGIPTLSDSDAGNYSDLLQLAASMLSRPDFLYAATSGSQGLSPEKRYVSFPDAGYHIQRSGWGQGNTPFEHEGFLIFDCGPLGDGGHGHYDMLNVEIAARGKSLIIDPGRYTYSEHPPNFRHWFKGTAAHNTVCIDGLDQVPYRRGKPKKKPLPQARLLERWSAPGFDVLYGTAQSHCYEVIHTRRIFYIADEYWVICDSLAGERPHRFDLRFHLAPEASERAKIVGNTVCAPDLTLVFSHGSSLQIEPGWFAPLYGVKQKAPVVSAVIEGKNSAEFVTVVMPSEPSRRAPELKILEAPANEAPGIALEIRGAGRDSAFTDYIACSPSITDHDVSSFQCRASAVWLRSSGEEDVRFAACNVQECRSNRDEPIQFAAPSQPVAWVSWDLQHGLSSGTERFE